MTRTPPGGRAVRAGLAAALAAAFVPSVAGAQGWRARGATRVQYVETRAVVLDSLTAEAVPGSGTRRAVGDTLLTCTPGSAHCFFYRPGPTRRVAPLTQDIEWSAWGFGLPGLRAYANVRLRAALGDEALWPRADDHLEVWVAYLELDRQAVRIRLGRDLAVTGLGTYGYDGASVRVRAWDRRLELETYGGWGLERGIGEPVTARALAPLDEFQEIRRAYLLGVRGAARVGRLRVQAVYQREIETDRSGLVSERVAADASFAPAANLRLRAHADYDLAAGVWGKAGLSGAWTPTPAFELEARAFRYRPVFSLQTIWVAFSPTPYAGWGLALRWRPTDAWSAGLEAERRDYADTGAEVPWLVTTDRTWRGAVRVAARAADRWEWDASYDLYFTFGSALHAGAAAVRVRPGGRWWVGLRGSAFQQLEEFRVGEGRVWSVGLDARWRGEPLAAWVSLDRYRHDRRADASTPDWTQLRAAAGLAWYAGAEPGRAP